jgi:hypothetical protein
MRESETFDAFYARTVSSVTSQLHALAAGDPQADHAIREAYARAYQQWFEVSGYRDPETWVLDAAKDAFARRQAQAEIAGPPVAKPDSGTWPGMYRERRQPPSDPDATVAPAVAGPAGAGSAGPAAAGPAGAGLGQGYAATAQAGPDPAVRPYQRDPYQSPESYADPFPADPGGGYGAAGSAGAPAGPLDAPAGHDGRGRSAITAGVGAALARPGSSRALLAVAAVVVLAAVAVGGYLAFGRGHNSPASAPPASSGATGPAPVRMLGAGQTGPRSSVPWTLVGAGWVLTEFSPGQPGSGGGPVRTYLVDPEGGRYTIAQNWPASAATTLIAWSGNTKTALFGTASGASTSYSLLNVRTGATTQLTLPAGVALTGFTRPDGLNLLAVQQGPARYKLERYDLQGVYQATLATMARGGTEPQWTGACSSSCGALSSPGTPGTGAGAGDFAVWGVAGHEMQLANNAGGIVRRLHVPHSGSPPSCTPVSWWDSTTVLASCAATGQPGESRLWLVPVGGGPATPETLASGSGSGAGVYTGAWQAGGQVYVTATSSSQCPSAPSGPGGLGVFRLASSGSDSPVSVPGSTSYHNAILGSSGGRLLVLAQTSCPGTSTLEWFNPSAGSTQPLLPAASGQAGVVAAVAYGTG